MCSNHSSMAEGQNDEKMTPSVSKKKSQGKKKIPIQLIDNKTRRQVTFMKRRQGLFRKAGELSSLTGAEVAVVAFSGAGKVYSFGHPDADSVVLRYVRSQGKGRDDVIGIEEKKVDDDDLGFVFAPIDENLGLVELEELRSVLEGLRNRAVSRVLEINSSSMGCDCDGDYDNVGVVGDQLMGCDYSNPVLGCNYGGWMG